MKSLYDAGFITMSVDKKAGNKRKSWIADTLREKPKTIIQEIILELVIPHPPKGEPDGFSEIWICVGEREGQGQLSRHTSALKRGDMHQDVLAAIKARVGVIFMIGLAAVLAFYR